MSVKTGSVVVPALKGNDQLRKRDEQIRRVLNAAQYKKYKETEKVLQAAVTREDKTNDHASNA
jgi:hypothetical protein